MTMILQILVSSRPQAVSCDSSVNGRNLKLFYSA
jgi:hypothetical protein